MLYKRGQIWWYTFSRDGHRYQVSTGSSSKEIAKRAESRKITELDEGRNSLPAKRRPLPFNVFAASWMDASRARWSPANIAIQNYNLKHILPYFGKMLLTDITAQDIGKYQGIRKDENASPRTTNMEIATLRQILKSARLWGNLADDVQMLREDESIGRALSPDEETRLVAACRMSPQPSLYTAVVVFSNTGLRNSELRTARWSQLDFLRREFTVSKKAKTRGSAGRIIPLNQTALAALTEWRARWPDAKPADYIFCREMLMFKGVGSPEAGLMTSYGVDRSKPLGSWKTSWGKVKKLAKVECRMHDLRHSFVSKLAETETPSAIIQSISGHLTRQMLEHYSHISKRAKQQAVANLDSPGQMVQ